MKRAVIILQRKVTMAKEVWRKPTTRRTFSILAAGPMLVQAWNESLETLIRQGVVRADLTADGQSLVATAEVKEAAETVRAAIFSFEFRPGAIALKIEPSLCVSAVGLPRRDALRIGSLTPWNPIRVLINGRANFTSGPIYSVADYYVCLAEGDPPAVFADAKLHDLQADLA
ncbi:MAG: hypothetical protein ABI823_18615 [Bryobacteraceae bacterium]